MKEGALRTWVRSHGLTLVWDILKTLAGEAIFPSPGWVARRSWFFSGTKAKRSTSGGEKLNDILEGGFDGQSHIFDSYSAVKAG